MNHTIAPPQKNSRNDILPPPYRHPKSSSHTKREDRCCLEPIFTPNRNPEIFGASNTDPHQPWMSTWNPKPPFINGCFNWRIPNLYIGNGCFIKHPFINGCLGFQVGNICGFKFDSWIFFCFPTAIERQKTLPETNMAPENEWLEYDPFLLGRPIFRGELLVLGRVGTPPKFNSSLPLKNGGWKHDSASYWEGLFFRGELLNFARGIYKYTSKVVYKKKVRGQY